MVNLFQINLVIELYYFV